jgi:hypothetical protein
MNTDYGLFNLFVALDSVRKTKNQPQTAKQSPTGALPEIDYSLLRNVLASTTDNSGREFRFVVLDGGLSTRNSNCSRKLTYSPS